MSLLDLLLLLVTGSVFVLSVWAWVYSVAEQVQLEREVRALKARQAELMAEQARQEAEKSRWKEW